MAASSALRWVRLAGILTWPLIFLAVLVYLPLTAFAAVPGYTLLGGMFVDLDAWAVFWISVAFFATVWSWMAATALSASTRLATTKTPIPLRAAAWLALPVQRPFFAFSSVVAGLGSAIVVMRSSEPWWLAAVASIAGMSVTYGVLILLALPTRLAYADDAHDPLPRSRFAHWVWRLAEHPPLVRAAVALRTLVSRATAALRLKHVLEAEPRPGEKVRRIEASHFFAITNLIGLLILLAAIGWVFFPPREPALSPPAAAFLYVLLTLIIQALSALDTHLSRLRISPALVLLLWAVTINTIDDTDHHYSVRSAVESAPELTPVQVAAAGRSPENLVIVASAGGGILAAGWTALALEKLIGDRPELVDEIRLLSTVSGGSVGAAFYVHGLLEHGNLGAATQTDRYAVLHGVYDRATQSTLTSAAYGFAFLDFWRFLLGGWLPVLEHWDRGVLLEDAWGRAAGAPDLTLTDLRPGIAEGTLPAVVLNATIMETGRRLMLTPIDFAGPPAGLAVEDQRARSLSEQLLSAPAKGEVADPGLWTAARLSATFPYVSPAARAEWADGTTPAEASPASRLHLIDGGYFDNFGVASSLDWLDPVLDARLAKRDGLPFCKVLVVQLNPFVASDPDATRPATGAIASLLGPVIGLTAIQNGTAISRNRIDLQRFLTAWRARFADAGIGVDLETVTFRPPPGDRAQPLSWHLTDDQIEDQRAAWPNEIAKAHPTIAEPWQQLKDFLGRPCPVREEESDS